MNKMKIVFIANIVLIIALVLIMLSLKDGYKEQAQTVVRDSTKEYVGDINKTLYAQGRYVDEWNLIWELVFETLNANDRSLSAFDQRIKSIESTYNSDSKSAAKLERWGIKELKMNISTEKTKRVVTLGEKPVVTFDFAKGNFQSVDYSALLSIVPSEMFKINQPAEFNFNAK